MNATTKSRARKPSALAKNLRRLMREAGIDNARQLDRHTGVSSETVRNLLGGRSRDMTEANLARIAGVLSAIIGRAITTQEMRGGAK